MYKIGHLQYKVKNLAQAMEAFKQLGFEIERGGEKSKNAFIWFNEGPYIELIEMNRTLMPFAYIFRWIYGRAMKARWKKWCCSQQGFIDFAIEAQKASLRSIAHFSKNKTILNQFEIKGRKVITWYRKNLKNEKIAFSYYPILPVTLPFVVSDYSTPQRPSSTIHSNQFTEIDKVIFVCQPQDYQLMCQLVCHDDKLQLKQGNITEIDKVILKNNQNETYQLSNKITLERM